MKANRFDLVTAVDAMRDLCGAVLRDAYDDLPKLDRDGARELLADIHRCESAAGIDGYCVSRATCTRWQCPLIV